MPHATPFHKILVANRGEIALRVMRTARSMGYQTVAVHSSADARAAHVLAADQAVCIGEPLPAQSYLRADRIIEAARATGADAVHPGYGFLAENADFAQACRAAGLVFIGPSPEAMRAMGDKAGAKRLMREAGVPCIPGYQGEDQSEARLAEEAGRIGYPVMIKATAGGGGRGMRLVAEAAQFDALLRSAQSEARNAFGDATVILERAIARPRHIEIQVFADRHGHVVHLGERDCSVQRRHQKLIEEAPSPAVDAALRERMGATAVAAALAMGYEGAGTLEFLLDGQGAFYFMEMNTRLQVEHPVTEAITGLDLVEWQLRVAAGEPLPAAQDAIRFAGHAIEVRLCAEDVAQGFMPQSGTLRRWQPPPGVRVEHALASGTAIPPWYDSMVAKIIAHGATRHEAARRLHRALGDLVALGVATNQAFLARCLAHPVFLAGGATTAFIAEQGAGLLAGDAQQQARQARARAVACWLLLETAAGQPWGEVARLVHRHPVGLRWTLDGEALGTRVRRTAAGVYEIEQDGVPCVLTVQDAPAGGHARFTLDGITEAVAWERDGATLWLHLAGAPHVAEDRSHEAALRAGPAGGDGKVRASMNGRVVALPVAVGDRVEAGQPVLVLEAMKMEHVHAATAAGVVAAVHAALGDQATAGRVLLEITPDDRYAQSLQEQG
ncbi:Acetyl-/propionyl-coenzyme A carboxylase alpha chain [Delftia tsuruhatensis]|uniref:acetyl-CoA carboxylase biotin carboxylase subunit n=1 Tax=Delftia tsuruhatensis TaxID=180282 RepID=UPI001E704EEB|nr:acetyl-CoA carboxylase biotin carboxylase subunit [Delftia tsuruhatensis]CAB5690547.1 Acetyl-/propionyl-coenzyme A carboxylase alpha chain [Delftia tsuruhatensis]CAC9677012.1 Acetyl-/propionyl-coenzyme A carboxylase alpha chain [Delftia tsuruhatensis]